MTDTTKREPKPFSRGIRLRVVAMLIGFTIVICATVIATDLLSVRDRHPVSATRP